MAAHKCHEPACLKYLYFTRHDKAVQIFSSLTTISFLQRKKDASELGERQTPNYLKGTVYLPVTYSKQQPATRKKEQNENTGEKRTARLIHNCFMQPPWNAQPNSLLELLETSAKAPFQSEPSCGRIYKKRAQRDMIISDCHFSSSFFLHREY